MRNYEETSISTLDELLPEIPPLRGVQQSNYYRGYADQRNQIRPSLFRADLEKSPHDSWLELANATSMKFKQLAPADVRNQLTTELEWTSTACHHRVPTHFTAWSEAALVALYFATEETPDEADGALWRLMPGHNGMTITQDYEQVPDAPRLYHPHYQTEEMTAQRVCFLTHPFPDADSPPVSFENYYSASSEAMNLCKILIPHDAKGDIRRQISAMGVDSRSIFPGLKGIGLQLSEDLYTHSDSYQWIM